MKRIILTSSSGVGLAHADRADMVVPFIFRFVSGPLPSAEHLNGYLCGRGPRIYEEVCWSDCVRQLPYVRREDRCGALLWFCEAYGVELIELWFDPEPNSQLQLIWILDYLRSEPSVAESLRLRRVDFELRGADPAGLRHRDVRELDVAESDLEIASMAWEAYRAPTPELCFGLLDRPLGKLCFLKPAMEDLLAELPSPTTGLGATETRLLELIARGHDRTDELFRPGALGTRVFDQWELGALLEGLASGPAPAIAGLDGKLATLDPDNARGRNAAFRRSRLSLTAFGQAALAGREDFRRHNPIRRWWGGTLLTNERLWRWDAQSRSLVADCRVG
ncbi:hypothetical protein GPL20_28025 [Bradyrhizobium cajani]|uniref:DUF1835 domain-containing protein n=2 Tax=Bradyrhizobium cajani TaxID=1928661 RepID=A0A844TER8_9BRAD|nr:hypothetical protein [Bradyrhizobium cajani]MCP3372513.1 hypothetical protein [Bradyrhizobium cajani]MVT76846.1 hypothetical protein [Bradyrhizobium cajani]